MKIFLLCILSVIMFISCSDSNLNDELPVVESEPPNEYQEKVYDGDIILSDQNDVDNFASESYTKITGDLKIIDSSGQEINDITELESIKEIGGRVYISSLDSLKDFNGLSNVKTIGEDLRFVANNGLNSINGFSSLETIAGELYFSHNSSLSNIGALNTLSTAESVSFVFNPNLISITGLNTLSNTGNLVISSNNSLSEISGFQSLESIDGYFHVYKNPALKNINGFNAVRVMGRYHVQQNHALTEIKGFKALEQVNSLFEIVWNDELELIDSFDSLMLVGSGDWLESAFISIHANKSLTSINGFDELKAVKKIDISHNYTLEGIEGFNTLAGYIDRINIVRNDEVKTLDCFQSLESAGYIVIEDTKSVESLALFGEMANIFSLRIGKNHGLKNLDALDKLNEINQITIIENEQLSDFCGLSILMNTGWNGSLVINSNLYDPTYEDLVAGNCSE